MGWILLESLVALLLAVFIVWWTMRGTGRRTPPTGRPPDRHARSSDPLDRLPERHDGSRRGGDEPPGPDGREPKR